MVAFRLWKPVSGRSYGENKLARILSQLSTAEAALVRVELQAVADSRSFEDAAYLVLRKAGKTDRAAIRIIRAAARD